MAQQVETQQLQIRYGVTEDAHVLVQLSTATSLLKLSPEQTQDMIRVLQDQLKGALEQRERLTKKDN